MSSLTESVHFRNRLDRLQADHEALTARKNEQRPSRNGVHERFRDPVLTVDHVPLSWRYDLNPRTNPFLMERMPVRAVNTPGAVFHDGRFVLVTRVEGADGKSFFALVESGTGVDGFRFRSRPLSMPETDDPDADVHDMRLTRHEDGWIYGLFRTDRRDPDAPSGDSTSAVSLCGIARTRDLETWERLNDLESSFPHGDAALHPEFVDGKYALYTGPKEGLTGAGSSSGIGWSLCESMERARIEEWVLVDERAYHTVKEVWNGPGPAPIWTDYGWLHLAHGASFTTSGLRSVLYVFMTALDEPWKVIHRPAGELLGPSGEDRSGEFWNAVTCNGWVARPDGRVYVYFASADTHCHVAMTSLERLLDYVMQTPVDGGRSAASVALRNELIDRNAGL